MKLTIGMIVKNEEKYLERCLNGLKPILDNIDSELIIADTGSTDRTVEIAKKFTDNIFLFEWINDFAAARNSTLEKAEGEWYMFIDGDEIFTSCDELIHFFNSGEYKKYNAASYVIRNLMPTLGDDTNVHYEDFNAPRLTKRQPHTRFVGEIHEELNTYMQPIKKLNDVVEHYGYLYSNDEEMRKKMKRNIELLQKKLDSASEADLPHLYIQFYESYINFDEEKAYYYLERGIEKAKETDNILLVAMFCRKAQDALAKCKYECALEACRYYFSMSKKIRPGALTTDAEIYAICASSNYNLGNYDAAIDNYIRFFSTYKLIKSDKLITQDAYILSYSIACDRNFLPLLNEFIYCCRHARKYNLASEYLTTLPLYKYSVVNEHVSVILGQILHVLGYFKHKNAGKYYKQLNGYGKKQLKDILFWELFVSDKHSEISEAITDIGKNDDMLQEKLRLSMRYLNNEPVTEEELYSFSKKYGINDAPEILFIALGQNYDITGLFDYPDFDMKLTVYKGYMNLYGFADAAEGYSPEAVREIGKLPEAIRFYEYCMKMIPIYKSPYPGSDEVRSVDKLFEKYAWSGRRYAESSGKEYDELSPELKSSFIAGEIADARLQKRYKDCFAAMKNAVTEYKDIAPVIDLYGKIVTDEYESEARNAAITEMEHLSVMIKSNIRKYISDGNFDAALKTIEEYNMINPNDTETDELTALIQNSQR